MPVSAVICPLCKSHAHASDIDFENRARVYCDRCSTYDITRTGASELFSASQDECAPLAQMAHAAPVGQILVIAATPAAGVHYEAKVPKRDVPAPDWLLPSGRGA